MFLSVDIYFITLLGSIVLGILYGLANYKKLNTSKKELLFFAIFVCIFGLFGSRFFSFLFRIQEAFESKEAFKSLLFSGFMFYGGIIGGIIGIYAYARRFKLDTMKYLDFCVVIVPLCHMTGRIGCFLTGCCYGIPVSSDCLLGFDFNNNGVHLLGTQLIEAAFNFILFVSLWFLQTKKMKSGTLSIVYCFTYPVFRFIIEFFRYDERGSIFFMSTSQFISVLFLIYGIYLIFKVKKEEKNGTHNRIASREHR